MNGQNTRAQEVCYDIPRLLQLFESLGENCDLGVVQRAVGLESFGLFRFAACDAAGVAALLRARLQPLGEPEDLWLDEVGPRREYWVKSYNFPFEVRTNRFAGDDDPEVIRTAQIEKLRFLRTHLLRDLSRGRRLLVFTGNADTAIIDDIAAQLQAYGPNCLLWISGGDTAHSPGFVKRISPNLLRGFISRFGSYDGDPSLPVEEWIAVCANSYRLWRAADPPQAPLDNLIARASATRSCRWLAESPSETRAVDAPAFGSGGTLEHKLGTAKRTSVYSAHLPIASGGNFALSAWVQIPEGFRGRRITMLLSGFSSIAMWAADLKSRARWQRIWVTANLPLGANNITCALIAEGGVGEVFHSAAWSLERGNRPLGYGFTL